MADRFDWPAAYDRIERAHRALEVGASLPPAAVDRVLRDRAQALAQPLPETRSVADQLTLLVLSLGGEHIAIDMSSILEVVPLRGLTPIPGTSPMLLGVVNHRGRLLPVFDLRKLIGLPEKGGKDAGQVVAVEMQGVTLGILAEGTRGIQRVAWEDVLAPPLTASGSRQAFIRGVTRDLVAVLDLAALVRNPRIVINEEVG